MHDDQDRDLEVDGPRSDGASTATPQPTSTVGLAAPRRLTRRWLIVVVAMVFLGAAVTVLTFSVAGRSNHGGFASATDLMNALKGRGLTCIDEPATQQLEQATSAIECHTHPGHYIIAAVYATQAAADSNYERVMHDFQLAGFHDLGLSEYFATGDRWSVHGDDPAPVQLAANALNGRYQVGT